MDKYWYDTTDEVDIQDWRIRDWEPHTIDPDLLCPACHIKMTVELGPLEGDAGTFTGLRCRKCHLYVSKFEEKKLVLMDLSTRLQSVGPTKTNTEDTGEP